MSTNKGLMVLIPPILIVVLEGVRNFCVLVSNETLINWNCWLKHHVVVPLVLIYYPHLIWVLFLYLALCSYRLPQSLIIWLLYMIVLALKRVTRRLNYNKGHRIVSFMVWNLLELFWNQSRRNNLVLFLHVGILPVETLSFIGNAILRVLICKGFWVDFCAWILHGSQGVVNDQCKWVETNNNGV